MKMTTVVNEWRDMVVPLALKDGSVATITGMVYGCFVTHIVVNEDDTRVWAVSHVPTGLRLTTYPNAGTFYDISPIVKKLHDKYGNVWNTDNANKARGLAESCKAIWQRDEVTA